MGAVTIASNAFRVGAIAVVGGLTLFLGKVLVGALSGIAAGLMVKSIPDHPEVNSLVVPIVVAFVVGYIIAAGFYATFSTAVNTLLLCFCEGKNRLFDQSDENALSLDCRINDGGETRPYFMSKSLMQFVQFADAKLSAKGGPNDESESAPLRVMR